MKILFSQNTKKANSTKIIDCASEFSCKAYGNFNPVTPTVILHGSAPEQVGATNYYKFVYAYIPALSRYYFVDSWSYNKGMWLCSLKCDVLASYHDAVLEAPVFINRAENGDPHEPDDVPQSGTMSLSTKSFGGWGGTATGQYILGIYDGNPDASSSNAVGSVKYYQINQTVLNNLQKKLWDASTLTETTGVNKANYIASCRNIPERASNCEELTESYYEVNGVKYTDEEWNARDESNDALIYFGNVSSTIHGNPIDPTTLRVLTFTVSVPKHPDAGTQRWWLNKSPYASYTLYHPCMGTVSLPSESLIGVSGLSVVVKYDLITGNGFVMVYATGASTGSVIATAQISVCNTVPLSCQSNTLSTVVGTTIANALTGQTSGVSIADKLHNFADKYALLTSTGVDGNPVTNVAGLLGDAIDWVSGQFASSDSSSNDLATVIQAIANQGLSINGFKVGGVPQVNSVGGLTGIATVNSPFYLISQFARVRIPGGLYGMPVLRNSTLGSYRGMVQATGAHVAPKNATAQETEAINTLMNGVVFVE